MTADCRVQTLDTLRTRLNHLHDRDGLSWRQIASRGDFAGIPPGTLWAIARQGREPKNHAHRHALGLPPVAIPVEPCPDCGRVHRQLATCDPKPRRATKRRRSVWLEPDEADAWDATAIDDGFDATPDMIRAAVLEKYPHLAEWRNDVQ